MVGLSRRLFRGERPLVRAVGSDVADVRTDGSDPISQRWCGIGVDRPRTVRNSSELRWGRQTQWVRFDRALAGHLSLDMVDDGDEVVAGGAGHAGSESGAVVLG